MSSKVDGVLELSGALGKYQWTQFVVLWLSWITSSHHFLLIIFQSITPNFRCAIPGWDNDTYNPYNEIHNQTIYKWIPTKEDGKLDSCNLYSNSTFSDDVTECSKFVFDDSAGGTTLNMHFNLVCSRSLISTSVKVVFTIGLCVGAVLVGIISDRFGRRPALIGCLFIGGVCGVISIFSVNIYMFAAFRFVIAGCFVGVILVAHCMLIEIVGPTRRVHIVALKSLMWPSGTMILSLMAYFLRDWNHLQLAISIPPICAAVIQFVLLKESPHFLVTKGRHEEAKVVFKRMAEMNGRELTDDVLEELEDDGEAAVKEKLRAILKAPVLLKRAAVFFYLWFIAGMGFYGLSFNVGNLSGDIYVNSTISAAVELPAAALIFLSYRFGRKPVNMISLFAGSVALLSAAIMNAYVDLDTYDYLIIIVAMVGKMAISIVFIFDYLWSSEAFPSSLRTSLVGIASFFSRVGSILSPIIVDLYLHVQTVFGAGLGALIFGITMLIGGLLTIYLPETNQQKVPETIAEANVFMTGRDGKEDLRDGESLVSIKS